MNTQQPSRPVRSWQRFSLRALLVCTALLAILFARWRSQRRLEREIEEIVVNHGGGVDYDWDERFRGRFWKKFASVDDFFVRRDLSVSIDAANMTTLDEQDFSSCLVATGESNLSAFGVQMTTHGALRKEKLSNVLRFY